MDGCGCGGSGLNKSNPVYRIGSGETLYGTDRNDRLLVEMDGGWVSAGNGDDEIASFANGGHVDVAGDYGNDFMLGIQHNGSANYYGGPDDDALLFTGSNNSDIAFYMNDGNNATSVVGSNYNQNMVVRNGTNTDRNGVNIFGMEDSHGNNVNFAGTANDTGMLIAAVNGDNNTLAGNTGNGTDVLVNEGQNTYYDLNLGGGNDAIGHSGNGGRGVINMRDGNTDIASVEGKDNDITFITDKGDIIQLDGDSGQWYMYRNGDNDRVYSRTENITWEGTETGSDITVRGRGLVVDRNGNVIPDTI